MTNELQLYTTKTYNGIEFDCYVEAGQQDTGDFWATRTQIGELLGYENPAHAIKDIHARNKERMDRFSRGRKLRQVEGDRTVTREVILYSFKGLLEICRYSNQPKADAIMDWLWEVADEIRRTGTYSVKKEQPALPSGVMDGARMIFEAAGIKDNQLSLALDNVYASYTGRSALKTGNVTLVAPTQNQLLTPTQIGNEFGLSAQRVNEKLAYAGYQHKIAGKWEPIGAGKAYGVMVDTGKRYKGTPVRQLKWDSGILPEFSRMLGESKRRLLQLRSRVKPCLMRPIIRN